MEDFLLLDSIHPGYLARQALFPDRFPPRRSSITSRVQFKPTKNWWYGLSGESFNLGLKSIIVGIVDRVDVLNVLNVAFGNVEKIKGYLILDCFRKR